MKPFDLLTPAAALLAIGSEWWQRSGRTLPGQPEWYLYAAAGLVVLHALLRGREIAALFSRRNVKYGTNTLVTALAVLAILGIVNWMAARNTKRWDVTKNRQWSLADQTMKVLAGLEGEAKLTYFNRDTGAGDPGRDRLREYEAAARNLKVVYVDPTQKPGLTRDYDITSVPTLVVEYGGKREKVTNVTEQDVTNALIAVTRKGEKTVCFAEGEGQRSIDDMGEAGFSAAKGALEKASYKTQKGLQAARVPKIPCRSAHGGRAGGPEKDPLPPATTPYSYVAAGGGVAGPRRSSPSQRRGAGGAGRGCRGEWEPEAGRDLVLDVSGVGQVCSRLVTYGRVTPAHEITCDFRVATVPATARSVSAGSASKPGVPAQNLVQTSALPVGGDGPQEPAGADAAARVRRRGRSRWARWRRSRRPLPRRLRGPRRRRPRKAKRRRRPRAAWHSLGDSDFATNQFLQISGNADFFLNTVAWLARDSELISIRPKEPEDHKLFLSSPTSAACRGSRCSCCRACGSLGVMNWWQRR